jgi:hypothetical protein
MDFKLIGYYLHILIPIGFILMPLLPIKQLKYAIFLPSILYFVWIVCGGCPLTQATQEDDEPYIQGLLAKMHPEMGKKTDLLIGFTLTLVLAIIAFKSLTRCNN